MKSSLLTPRRVLIAIIVVLVLLSFLPAGYGRVVSIVPKTVLDLAMGPPQQLLHSMSGSIRPGRSAEPEYPEGIDFRERFEHAKTYTAQLENELQRLNQEIQRLTRSAEFFQLEGVDPTRARVSSISSSDTNPLMTIDKGSRQGIRRSLAVISGTGLVGEVVGVTPVSSEVRLITTDGQRLQVRVSPSEAVSTGYVREAQVVWDASADRFIIEQADADTPIEPGDVVQLADPRWQSDARGAYIGTVVEVRPDPNDPYRFSRVLIEPALPLRSLTRVTVLVPVSPNADGSF